MILLEVVSFCLFNLENVVNRLVLLCKMGSIYFMGGINLRELISLFLSPGKDSCLLICLILPRTEILKCVSKLSS